MHHLCPFYNHDINIFVQSDGTPKFSASKFNYCSAFEHHVEKGWGDVYVQDKGNTRMLKPGMRFLYCE